MSTADSDDRSGRWSGAAPLPLTVTSSASASASDPRDACCTATQNRHSTPGSGLHPFLPATTPASTTTSTPRFAIQNKHTLPPMATGITASSTSHIFHRQSAGMYHSNQPQYNNYSPPTLHQPAPPPPSSSRSSADVSPSTRPHRQLDVPTTHSTSVKSLPSIHEALGKSNPLPYPHPPQSSVCGPSQSSGLPASSSSLIPGPSAEGPSGPSNPFSSTNSSAAPSLRDTLLNSQHPHHQSAPSQSEGSIRSQDSQNRSIHSIGSEKSVSRGSVPERTSICTSHAPGFDMLSTTTTAMSSPTSYVSPVSYNQPQYPSHRAVPPSQTFPPPSFENRSSHSTWNFGASDHTPMDGVKSMQRSNGISPYSDAVKRHLDDYDVRASLNEVRDTSSRTLDLLRPHSQRPPSTRPESIDSLPSLAEIDELLHLHRHAAEILERVRSAAISHEHSLSEQRSQQQLFKTEPTRDKERMTMYGDEYKNGTSVNGSNTHTMNSSISLEKKRRKAAPPGRCHSCNRAETPEWRRGPDGARTLCNACGLHYAKLTRKAGLNKTTSSSSSAPTSQMAMAANNIRPRGGVGPRSPPIQS
ncbi:NsdD protein [Arthroderma uncinatum]|uniref:NsdD protein n=1 Tax=Arthroderma uncinatum TaxID=74035 RepID=UPI00144AF0C6|nr:NsdD protein [Arthroderma uncinatum]KAF3491016.1 NsdD protein [Arthroderma uncinatum]